MPRHSGLKRIPEPKAPPLTPIEKARIKDLYCATWNYSYVARELGFSQATVSKVVKSFTREELITIRDQKVSEAISIMSMAHRRLVEALFDEKKIREASLLDVAKTVGIVTDKIVLQSAHQRVNGAQGEEYDVTRLTVEEQVQLVAMRDKMLISTVIAESTVTESTE